MPRPRRLSLYRLTALLVVSALLYVGAIGLHVLVKFQPEVARIARDSEAAAVRFEEFRRRASYHAVVRASLGAGVRGRSGAALAPDSLEAMRRGMQAVIIANPVGAETLLPLSSAPAFVQSVDRVIVAEGRMRAALIATIAALELGDREVAQVSLARADSLDPILTEALAAASERAMAEVRRREGALMRLTEDENRVILTWFLIGLVVFPLAIETLRRRFREPLEEITRGLGRLSAGDLGVTLRDEGDDELGRLAKRFNVATDSLRQRVEAEETRLTQRSLDRARALMDASLDAVIVVDAAGAIREWNPQATALFGWEREQMLGVNCAGLLFPERGGDAAAAARLRAVLAGDDAALRQRTRATARRGDGDQVLVELGVARLEAGDHREYAVFLRDVSGEEGARQALLESEARYRAAFDQSVLGKLEIDREGVVLRTNAALLEVVGRPTSQVVGRSYLELLPATDVEQERRDFEALRQGEVEQVRRDREFRRRDGRTLWLNWIGTPVRDAVGHISHVLVTVQDVTARIELERELRQAHKMDAVGQLAGGVAHDFNNILAGIIGYADLLEHEAGGNEAIRHEARAIVATAQRGADLAQKLLALARELPTTLAELDARDVVHEVHGIIKRAFDRNVEIRVDVEDVPVAVRADRTQLANAVLNLALNARDAMPTGGRLTLRARHLTLDATACAKFGGEVSPGRYAAVTVTDTGTGMSREVLSRIFDPFFTTKEHGKGTGLGLAMVYGMVRAHQGVVDVESVLGVGSTFTIYLPALERLAAAPAAEPAPQLVRGRGEVLLADDETTVREVATRMLRRLGFSVEAVSDGAQAVARFRAEPDRFAFVLLDGDMPRMHGRDAARTMRDLRPEARIFLATGYLTASMGSAETATLFTAVLSKPYTLQELSRVIAAHLRDPEPVG